MSKEGETVAEIKEEEIANSELEEDDTKAIEDPAALVINFKAVDSFLQKFHALEKDVHELKQADHSATILESIKSQSHTEGLKKELNVKKAEYKEFIEESVTNEVKNQLSKILPKAVSDFATSGIQSTIKETLEQTLVKILIEKIKRSQSYQTTDEHKILYDELVNSYLLDKDLFELYGQTISLKRNHEEDKDKDPSARPNQGKDMKKREAESSKKSSTPKESTKVKEPELEVQMDFKEPTFENVANDADVPHVDPKPRILKLDWLTQPPRPETPKPDWNTIKTVDDASE
ncbi:hypothetical protein Tco_1442421 [Tanacetum coccineum]